MFNQLMRYDRNWRCNHRRYMDEASFIKQITVFCILMTSLVLFLMFLS